jgi:hypothetical protein
MSTLGEEFLEFFSSSCIEAVDLRGIASPSEADHLACSGRWGQCVGLSMPDLTIVQHPFKKNKGRTMDAPFD